MSIRKVVVASAFSLVSLAVGTLAAGSVRAEEVDGSKVAQKAGQCEARIVSAQTSFPKDAQRSGEGGVVRVQVVLEKDGRVVSSKVTRSSGSYKLDRAAEKSVAADWRFDVSHCVANSVPTIQEVNVVYQRVPVSFSASLNRRGIAYAKKAAADDQCRVIPDGSSGNVISCIQDQTPGGNPASGLATR